MTSSSVTEITCHLQENDQSSSSLLDSDAGSQVDGYISGAGFAYQRWDVSDLGTKTYAGLKAALDSGSHSMTLLEEGVRGEWESTNVYGEYYGQVFKGYFYAPVSGNYTFRGSADDSFGLYMSDEYGSKSLNSDPLIYASSHSSDADNYYLTNYSTAVNGEKLLEGGKYYYTELYQVNGGSTGFLKVSVSVPNNNTDLLWQTHEVN